MVTAADRLRPSSSNTGMHGHAYVHATGNTVHAVGELTANGVVLVNDAAFVLLQCLFGMLSGVFLRDMCLWLSLPIVALSANL